jgi:GNAT superfamily N-acetyltransferase
MIHSVLDNPIWSALTSGSAVHALGNESVKYMQRDKGLFVGFSTYQEREWKDLEEWLPDQSQIILFTAEQVHVPANWQIKAHRQLLQLVYDSVEPPVATDKPRTTPLSHRDIPAMLDLTSRTNPGPFFQKTIELGYYEGIFAGEKLVAMAGQRLCPDPYVEVSAVCTATDFVGKGFAAELVRSQVRYIMGKRKNPFLHVNTYNDQAIRLYEKIGFRLRKKIWLYVLERVS